ncbi:hypothetical protein [Microbacterium sp. NPDC055357]
MIAAGLALLAVGVADLIRQFQTTRRRWIAMALAAVVVFLVAVLVDAAVWGLVALAVAAAWVLTMPARGGARAGLWPVGLFGAALAGAVIVAGPRAATTAFDTLWALPAPGESVPVDLLVLVVGAVAFLLESSNIVVRTALRAEHTAVPDETEAPAAGGLKGGRLIGPLERVIVFALMLTGAYTLIAAVLAAKGIVRFPEISRDSTDGNRAEFFLVGSLVSWVLALAAALLVWWAAR